MAGHGNRTRYRAPAFAQQIDAGAEAFAEFVDWSPVDAARRPGPTDRDGAVCAVAVMVSPAELWSVAVHPMW